MRRVLVTGGSGFIGSHVVDALLAAGIAPRIYDRRPSPHHGADEVECVLGDLLDVASLEEAMADCAAVIHLAAAADVGIVAEDPAAAEQTNARGTVAVLEAVRATGVPRLVYGSTVWVYGESEDEIVTEDSALGLPRHVYTASKLAGEMYCTSYAELYDVEYTILRFGIPYGPRARPAAVIPIFVGKALAGEPLTIAGDGAQTRRFVYVGDLAEGVVGALCPAAANRVYNLASSETVTIRELAEVVHSEVGGGCEIVHTPGRSGDFGGAEISSRRAAEELGWRASTSLYDGVRHYLSWLREESPVPEPTEVVEQGGRRRLGDLMPGGGAVTIVACIAGTMLSYLLAARLSTFDSAETHTVGFMTLAATLICFSVLPASGERGSRFGAAAAAVFIAYLVLFGLPWTRSTLGLAAPGFAALMLSALGAVVGLGIVLATGPRSSRAEPEPDHAT